MQEQKIDEGLLRELLVNFGLTNIEVLQSDRTVVITARRREEEPPTLVIEEREIPIDVAAALSGADSVQVLEQARQRVMGPGGTVTADGAIDVAGLIGTAAGDRLLEQARQQLDHEQAPAEPGIYDAYKTR